MEIALPSPNLPCVLRALNLKMFLHVVVCRLAHSAASQAFVVWVGFLGENLGEVVQVLPFKNCLIACSYFSDNFNLIKDIVMWGKSFLGMLIY